MIREINGESITFAKAAQSHWEGTECLYVGQSADGSVKLFESDSPESIISTTPANLKIFASAVVGGEFDLQQ